MGIVFSLNHLSKLKAPPVLGIGRQLWFTNPNTAPPPPPPPPPPPNKKRKIPAKLSSLKVHPWLHNWNLHICLSNKFSSHYWLFRVRSSIIFLHNPLYKAWLWYFLRLGTRGLHKVFKAGKRVWLTCQNSCHIKEYINKQFLSIKMLFELFFPFLVAKLPPSPGMMFSDSTLFCEGSVG